ncbi:hypothetical protein OJ997_15175 [Solirubrobacter phytolaccae]|uniref:Uncharacterized protein n=1 Tax=Solirubrobacter phytolaccae TaxID=1404360 RepID=A0A9X3NCU6_9ACTN|nr:hypothetical protein [Solirubrobacter phytolaccae]MDA0181646.1 hypothetical protein [Solirubrobacter phytolaccae]
MTLIPELREELRTTAVRHARPRRRRRWWFGLAPVVLVAGTTAALAASGVLQIPIGEPAKDPPELTRLAPTPNTEIGTVAVGTERLLAVRAPDPDGGPEWGLQLASTTRGLGCLLPGRVAQGRIGELGDDGRLHPYPRDVVRNPGECALLDRGDRLFHNVARERYSARAVRLGPCSPGATDRRLCTDGPARTLLYGTLGPRAKAVVYRTPDRKLRTLSTVGPEGAYLIVLPAGASDVIRSVPDTHPLDERIVGVHFDGGRTCAGSALRSQETCPIPAYRPLRVERVTQKDVSAKIHARFRQGRRFWNLRVSFRVPRAVTDARTAYSIRISPPGNTGRGTTGWTRRDLKRGERVEQLFSHVNGGGEYRIWVRFHQATDPGQANPLGANGVTVGRLRVKIP